MKTYILPLFSLLLLIACNDSFLDKTPVEVQTEATALKSYENFKTYAWGFYDTFTDATNYMQGIDSYYFNGTGDFQACLLSNSNQVSANLTDQNGLRNRTVIVPSSGGGWSFSFIRKVNIMYRNIDAASMTAAEKAHWKSVANFFFCFRYAELISRFGDVPWINQVVEEKDTVLIYGTRAPRKIVADSVLARLQYAEANIKVAGDGANTINKACVQALMSRFCLFEGTWRKYHKLGDETKYLQECERTSAALMTLYPTVDNNWDGLFNSKDLSTRPGTILYKQYVLGQLGHSSNRYERSTSMRWEGHRFLTDQYLVKSNGKPVTNAANAARPDVDMFDEFRDRDPRLYYTFVPPYCEKQYQIPASVAVPWPLYLVSGNYNTANGFYNRPADLNPNGFQTVDEYKNLLPTLLSDNLSKRVPALQWGFMTMLWSSPNFSSMATNNQLSSRTGYTFWRNYNLWDSNDPNGSAVASRPIFFIEEFMLNYAEATWELGKFSQAIADNTINKLRNRTSVKVAPMVVAQIDGSFDPSNPGDLVTPGRDLGTYGALFNSGAAVDYPVDPVLWEIRRERTIELLGLGYGFADIRRWRKGPWFMNRPVLGAKLVPVYYKTMTTAGVISATTPAWATNQTYMKLVNKDYTVASNAGTVNAVGYVPRYDEPSKTGKGWENTFYLFPIPKNDLNLNNKLVQNPGWEKY